MIHVRDARADDVVAIATILNSLIDTTTISYRSEPHSLAEREAWFDAQVAAGLPTLVAVDDGAVVGFATYGPFRDNERLPGFRFTVEHSVHVDEAAWGKGVGRRLMDELIVRAAAAGVHVMVGAVDAANEGSVRFHERVGFVEQGRLREVGWKHDRWLDLVFMVRRIDW
jgi:L-amino acid N-acyltransferase YncA